MPVKSNISKSILSTHKRFMRIALEQARKGIGKVYPNPTVGCVIVKNNKIIAQDYHKRFGGPHAEVLALKKARKDLTGARLYVTLEPCSHFGKTPPCTDAIIASGIREVIVSMMDPSPAARGKGIKILREKGINVICGILEKEAEGLNKEFIERMKRSRPYVTLKLAQSLDGKIATRSGDSKWISSAQSRALVHKMRASTDAIMVGVNTILKDNPMLSVRSSSIMALIPDELVTDERGRCSKRDGLFSASDVPLIQPIKIVIDSRLKTPVRANIFDRRLSPGSTIVATTKNGPAPKEKILKKKGAEILCIEQERGRVNLVKLMKELGERGIANILVEGGGELAASLIDKGLVDKVVFFIAHIVVGGKSAIPSVGGKGVEKIQDAVQIKDVKVRKVGKDLLVQGNVYRNS